MSAPVKTPPIHAMPFVRIELAAFAVVCGNLQVLLGRRAEAPYAGRWALPGGVLRIDLDEDLDAACQRVARERLGVGLPGATQLVAVGGKARDPRAPWALSVVYRCTTSAAQLAALPGKRMAELKWADAETEGTDAKLAFDHAILVQGAVRQLRAEVAALRFPAGLLDETFTLGELQTASEVVLGHPLDKSSFRRRLEAAGVVQVVPGEMRTGPNRPAQVFTLAISAAQD